ncbi:MAG: prepilin peptidase, partial [Planctomycetes bacterium]|nr:prepilin peptidase [Planctomycetota bacterium]
MTIPIIDIFVWVFGLCVGSFLNVAIYRLPLGLSVSRPRWSFCPGCNHTLAWYDNLPLVSWLALRGRCRTCRSEISVQYPLVEAITGLAFVLAYRLLFVFDARVGLVIAAVPTDWPLLLAWLTLVAALIACAGMDIGSYQIDVSVTNLAVVAGIVLLALWPGSRAFVPLAMRPITAGCTAAFLAGVIMLWLTLWRHPMSDTPAESPPKSQQPGSSSLVPGVVAVLVCVGAAIWLSCSSPRTALTPELDGAAGFSFDTWIARVGWAAPVSLAVIFLLMVLAASRDRPADAELHQAIEEEAPHARRVALSELLWLLPCIVAGVLAWLVVGRTAAGGSAWANLVQYAPVAGAVYAMHGAVVGA